MEKMGVRVEIPPYALDLVTPAGEVGGTRREGTSVLRQYWSKSPRGCLLETEVDVSYP